MKKIRRISVTGQIILKGFILVLAFAFVFGMAARCGGDGGDGGGGGTKRHQKSCFESMECPDCTIMSCTNDAGDCWYETSDGKRFYCASGCNCEQAGKEVLQYCACPE